MFKSLSVGFLVLGIVAAPVQVRGQAPVTQAGQGLELCSKVVDEQLMEAAYS